MTMPNHLRTRITKAYVHRMVAEKDQLDNRIRQLKALMDGPQYDRIDPAEQYRMRQQLGFMQDYSTVLDARIEHSQEFITAT